MMSGRHVAKSFQRFIGGISRARASISQLPSITSLRKEPTTSLEYDQRRPRLIDMTGNGEKVLNALFSENEMLRRLSNLRLYMTQTNFDACVLTSYHNVNYFSGFHYCAFGRNYALIVTKDRAVTVSAGIDGGQPWRRSVGDNITYTDWQKDNFFYAVQQELDGVMGQVGFEFDDVSVDDLQKFDSILPNEKADIGTPTMFLRMFKSDEEIEVIKEGARIANVGGAAIIDSIKEGVPEYEVAMVGREAMIREIAKTYPKVELMDTWVWFQSGTNTDGAHNPVTTRKVEKGDILSLNCFPMIGGYYTALERTMFFGRVSDEALKLWEMNCLVHRRGLELIRPGARCCDIAEELNDIYNQHGLLKYRSFGYGHSFGVLSHYYGREAALELREDVDTVLQQGMVVSMEPMITIPESEPGAGGYREHDILVVTEDGAENITKFPFGPDHLIIKEK